ncbi:MAG: DUF3783 domain-containing protein [Thermoplasmata archaeon]
MKKVVILHNFAREEYARLLDCLKSSGAYDNTIVAVTTDTTVNWKVGDLIKELLIEDENIRKERDP